MESSIRFSGMCRKRICGNQSGVRSSWHLQLTKNGARQELL